MRIGKLQLPPWYRIVSAVCCLGGIALALYFVHEHDSNPYDDIHAFFGLALASFSINPFVTFFDVCALNPLWFRVLIAPLWLFSVGYLIWRWLGFIDAGGPDESGAGFVAGVYPVIFLILAFNYAGFQNYKQGR